MSHEQDWQEFRDAIRITREIMHQPALDQYRGREISPGVECQTDEQLDEFVRNHAETASIRAVPAKWVTTRCPWLTAKAAYTG